MELGKLFPTVSLIRFFLASRGPCKYTGSWSWENCPNGESHEILSGFMSSIPLYMQAHGAGGTFPSGKSHEILSGFKRGMQIYRLMELGELFPMVSLMRFSLAPRGACSSAVQAHGAVGTCRNGVSLMRFFLAPRGSSGGTCPNRESQDIPAGSKRGMQLYKLMDLGELVPTVSLMRFSLAPSSSTGSWSWGTCPNGGSLMRCSLALSSSTGS
jgi:hypothetical protein